MKESKQLRIVYQDLRLIRQHLAWILEEFDLPARAKDDITQATGHISNACGTVRGQAGCLFVEGQ